MQAKKPLALAVLILALLTLALAMTTTGCGSEGVTTTQATASPTTAAEAPTTAAPQSTTATTSTAAMASTTTTAPSRPITTELRPGETRLDNGHIQATGYIIDADDTGLQVGTITKLIRFVPADLLTEEEVQAGVSNVRPDDRQRSYYISLNATITVYTLGDGGEQNITADEFMTIWRPNPPVGGEHLADALWTIERDDRSEVVSITEVTS
ncbi:MAG: hypothetical protein JXA87_11650 [Thermoleophilia bacterium]|nr:hypothetical protein [Thermoleophilia bacterium]